MTGPQADPPGVAVGRPGRITDRIGENWRRATYHAPTTPHPPFAGPAPEVAPPPAVDVPGDPAPPPVRAALGSLLNYLEAELPPG